MPNRQVELGPSSQADRQLTGGREDPLGTQVYEPRLGALLKSGVHSAESAQTWAIEA